MGCTEVVTPCLTARMKVTTAEAFWPAPSSRPLLPNSHQTAHYAADASKESGRHQVYAETLQSSHRKCSKSTNGVFEPALARRYGRETHYLRGPKADGGVR